MVSGQLCNNRASQTNFHLAYLISAVFLTISKCLEEFFKQNKDDIFLLGFQNLGIQYNEKSNILKMFYL